MAILKSERYKRYVSVAIWPKDEISLSNADNDTRDEHYTEPQARAVIDALMADGFGGEGKIFPIQTAIIDKDFWK